MISYHHSYEDRYKKAYAAGADYWGHTPNDEELSAVLAAWVDKHDLKGKKIIEFFCGEGASGVILSRLGCLYHGVDVSASAVQKANSTLGDFPAAKATVANVVTDEIGGMYDAALDVMGFHMLVTDPDRLAYLKNVFSCLKDGAPMLFFRMGSDETAIDDFVSSYDDWLKISGDDYTTPRQMYFRKDGQEFEIQIPRVPGRSKSKEGYIRELMVCGFVMDSLIEMPPSYKCGESVSIYARRGGMASQFKTDRLY